MPKTMRRPRKRKFLASCLALSVAGVNSVEAGTSINNT